MKNLAIIFLTITLSLTSFNVFAQFEELDSMAYDSTYIDTLYNDFPADTAINDTPGTVKEILNESAQTLEQNGRRTLNNLTNKATYETGQFLNRQADKLMNGLKQKLSAKKQKNSSAQNQKNGKLVGKNGNNRQRRN